MRQLKREELAWAAGFFDGEGWSGCSITKSKTGKNRRIIHFTVVQAYDPELLWKFWESVGGIGTVKLDKPGVGRSPMYRWRVTGFERVQYVAAILWQWLGSYKQEQYTAAVKKWMRALDAS